MGQVLLFLGEVLAYVARILGLAGTILSVVQFVQGTLQGTQGGSSWPQLSNEVGTSLAEIENPTYGLNALAALIAAARTDILAAVGTPAQAGVPVDVSSGSVSAISSDWQNVVTNQHDYGTYGIVMNSLANMLNYWNNTWLPGIVGAPYFAAAGEIYGNDVSYGTLQTPAFDPTAIGPNDTLLSFLEAQNPFPWAVTLVEDNPLYQLVWTINNVTWICTVSPLMFDQWQHYLYTPSSGPPERSVLGDTQLLLSLIPLQYS